MSDIKTTFVKKLNIKNILIVLACAVISILYMYLFSYATSPLYPYVYGNDSGVFQIIGRGWMYGKIPYRDLFDHKGPMIFFINMLGYMIGNDNRIGVFYLQNIFFTISLLGVYKIVNIKSKNVILNFFIIILTVISFAACNSQGNKCEEWTLPFIIWTMYFSYKHIISNEKKHNVWCAFFYGITVGVCIMMKISCIIAFAGFLFVIFIELIRNKQYKNLFLNIFAGFVGMMLIIIPFLIYFAKQGLLGEMFDSIIGLQGNYIENLAKWAKNKGLLASFVLQYNFYIYYFCLLVVILQKNLKKIFVYILTILFTSRVIILENVLAYYTLICVPSIAFLYNEIIYLYEKIKNGNIKKWYKYLSYIVIALSIGFCVCLSAYHTKMNIEKANKIYKENIYNDTGHKEKDYQYMLDMIPKDEKESFVATGFIVGDSIDKYIDNGTLPYYKYFFKQNTFYEEMNKDFAKKMYECYEKGDCKWILYNKKPEEKDPFEKIFDSRYIIYAEDENYILYRLKE